MYLLIYKNDCVSCENAKKFLMENSIKFKEVNCSKEKLDINEIEIMKTAPENNLSAFIKKRGSISRMSIPKNELKEMYDNFLDFGSFPIIIKYNFLNQIENYMIGFVPKVLEAWINDDSIVGQYIDVNLSFKSKDCCYLCDKKKIIGNISTSSTLNIQDSIQKWEALKLENNNLIEKYTKTPDESLQKDELNSDSDNLIMAHMTPEYERPSKKSEFSLKNESTSTIEIPMYSELLIEEEIDEEANLIEKFKSKMKQIGKNKFTRDQDFVVEHIDTFKEESHFSPNSYVEESKNNNSNGNLKNVNQMEKDLQNLTDSFYSNNIPNEIREQALKSNTINLTNMNYIEEVVEQDDKSEILESFSNLNNEIEDMNIKYNSKDNDLFDDEDKDDSINTNDKDDDFFDNEDNSINSDDNLFDNEDDSVDSDDDLFDDEDDSTENEDIDDETDDEDDSTENDDNDDNDDDLFGDDDEEDDFFGNDDENDDDDDLFGDDEEDDDLFGDDNEEDDDLFDGKKPNNTMEIASEAIDLDSLIKQTTDIKNEFLKSNERNNNDLFDLDQTAKDKREF